ncbi:MAG: hypothetical protein JWL73_3069 [Actinomycetia bacterium]|nr:hypothetical protein [Actinomycetes bacterium]
MPTLADRLRRAAPWSVVRERDLLYIPLGADEIMVVACDSDGGIGPKPADAVPFDATELGHFAVRVPLLELVAAGATAVVVVDALSVERDPTGAAILAGVLAEAATAGVGAEAVTGSTEDNVPTTATGIGVTVIGRATIDALRAGRARAGDHVLLLGRPMSAPLDDVRVGDPEILTVPALTAALALPTVHEALPIGSGGVTSELLQLATSAGLGHTVLPDWPVAPDQTGGPSTAALLAVAGAGSALEACTALTEATGLPAWSVATLTA